VSTPLPLPEPQPQAATSRKPFVPLISLAVVAAVVPTAAIAWNEFRTNRILAAVDEACRESVTEWAKYPGGVQFPDELEFEQDDNNGDVWRSTGVVDFPNGWGTPVRQDFSCRISMDGTEVVSPFALVTSRDDD